MDWFAPKQIGWGLTPHGWQGWVLVALFAVALTFLPKIPGMTRARSWAARGVLVVALVTTAVISYRF